MGRPGVRRSLLVFAASRLITLAVAYAVTLISRRQSVLDVLSRWDGGWYLSVARIGYPNWAPTGRGVSAQNNIAFFPGYPLVIKGVSAVTRVSPTVAGIAVSMAAGAATAVALWLLAERLTDARIADRTVVLFSFFPSAFILSMVYSDGLFLLCASVCLLALLDERWLVAGLAAALGSLVRFNGLVLALCCAWAAVQAIRRHGSWRAAVAPVLAPMGALAYFAYLRLHTGDVLAYFHVEDRGWGQRFDFGLSNARTIVHDLQVHKLSFFVLLVGFLLAGVVVGLYLLVRWRPPAPIVVYIGGVVGLAVLTSFTNSMPRFLLSGFPLLIPIAEYLPDDGYALTVAVSAALMATLFLVTGTTRSLIP